MQTAQGRETHRCVHHEYVPAVSWRLALATMASAATVFGGCGDNDEAVRHSPIPGNGEVVEVRALDNVFRGERTVISSGTEVLFFNGGRNDHDITPAAGSGWGVAGAAFRPGDTYAQVFITPGEYPYYCKLHGSRTAGMTGVVVVEDS